MFYSRDLTSNSEIGGVVIITIPDPAADITHTESRPCRKCLVSQQSGTAIYMNINVAATAETGFKIAATRTEAVGPFEIPIDDVQKLHFFGTAGDIAQILWFGE